MENTDWYKTQLTRYTFLLIIPYIISGLKFYDSEHPKNTLSCFSQSIIKKLLVLFYIILLKIY